MAALADAERIFVVLDTKPKIVDYENAIRLDRIEGEIRFEDVSFGYNVDTLVLRHIDFKADPGKTMALGGPMGAGKTTIINLLSRFYDVDSDKILVDRHDLRELCGDQILVINESELIKRGKYEELLEAKGFYYNLYVS